MATHRPRFAPRVLETVSVTDLSVVHPRCGSVARVTSLGSATHGNPLITAICSTCGKYIYLDLVKDADDAHAHSASGGGRSYRRG